MSLAEVFADQPGLTLAQRGGGLISRGSRNSRAVKAIQERLSQLGYEVENDGLFGDQTDRALREFQRSKGLREDGVVGKQSLGKLLSSEKRDPNAADISMNAVTRVVGNGQSERTRRAAGLGETRAQQRGGGRAAGRDRGSREDEIPKGPNGGRIDPVTGKEVATSTTGPIGSTELPETPGFKGMNGGPKIGAEVQQGPVNGDFEKLHPRGPGGKFAAKGSSGPQVSATQKGLNTIANDKNLKVDGDFGDKTDEAVRQYQSEVGLKVDGIVGPQTAASIRRRLGLIERYGHKGAVPKIRKLERKTAL